jgi:hypothetical protein
MTLQDQAIVAVPPTVPPVPITCHVAVWFWAAQEAQAQGLTGAKAPQATLQRIAAMPGAPQGAMLALPRVPGVAFNFAAAPPLPAAGTVLLWTGGPTHSAIVTGPNALTSYNQGPCFNVGGNMGYTTVTAADNLPGQNLCYQILAADIVHAAGVVFNL